MPLPTTQVSENPHLFNGYDTFGNTPRTFEVLRPNFLLQMSLGKDVSDLPSLFIAFICMRHFLDAFVNQFELVSELDGSANLHQNFRSWNKIHFKSRISYEHLLPSTKCPYVIIMRIPRHHLDE